MTDVTIAPEPPLPTEPVVNAVAASIASLPIEALQDVEMKVEVVLGRARLRLQNLLEIRTGQVIELDRTRNSPVEVLVNGTLFARGEIVVIDETHLGVRIGEVVTADNSRGALSMGGALIAATSKTSTLPDISVGHLLGQTVIALAVIIGGLWLVQKLWTRNRNRTSARSGRSTSDLTVLARHSLGKDHHLAIVRWGEREVLVGIAGQNITFYEDGSGVPLPSRGDLQITDLPHAASTPLAENLSATSSPGRSPFAASLSAIGGGRPQRSETAGGFRPVLERLRDLTERS